MTNQVPIPQNTKLYQVVNGAIVSPRISTNSIVCNCSASSYSDLKNNQWLYQVYNQNVPVIHLYYNDKSLSIFRPNLISYYSFDGTDPSNNNLTTGLTYRFLNLSSPSIQFLPLVSLIYTTNITITNNVISNITTALQIGNYLFLANQTSTAQNGIYRVISINGSNITVYLDSRFNTILTNTTQNILTRIAVSSSDLSSANYYGIYYNGASYDIYSQTNEIFLGFVDYGITQTVDLTGNYLPISIFNSQSITPQIGQKIALNISSGGYTSGIYEIYKLANNLVYFQPVYSTFVFYQQFIKVALDLNTLTSAVWLITNKINQTLYGSCRFSFSTMSITQSILSDPSLWATQIGLANDTIIGWPLYLNSTANPYISNSDTFITTVQVPTWVSNSSELIGLSLNIYYGGN
jgi:hypothetical protein